MTDIVQRDASVLRQVAKSVPLAEISSPKIQDVITQMKKAMAAQKDGVAIAAPQIGISLRIFIVSGPLLKQADKKFKGDGSDLVFINPEIIKISKEKREVEEGCLSVRWLYGKVRRSLRATLKARNERGEAIERGASGLLAQIFQHEIDHLNGTLFIDKAKEIWEMTETDIKEATDK